MRFFVMFVTAVCVLFLINRMWFRVVCTLVDNDTRHYSDQNVVQQIEIHHKALCFALVVEYVSGIHPWARVPMGK